MQGTGNVLQLVWDGARIRGNDRIVLLALARLANANGTYHGDMRNIAREAGMHRPHVAASFRNLRAGGWVSTIKAGRILVYQLNLHKLRQRGRTDDEARLALAYALGSAPAPELPLLAGMDREDEAIAV